MQTLIVYDSYFGNTEQVARVIGNELAPEMDVEIISARDVKPADLPGFKLLIVGSPTRQFKATAATIAFLRGIPKNGLRNIAAAAFDTRISTNDIESRFLKWMVNFFGYAAKPVADRLRKKGAVLVIEPEGFFVEDTEGPLKEGESERAVVWARRILQAVR